MVPHLTLRRALACALAAALLVGLTGAPAAQPASDGQPPAPSPAPERNNQYTPTLEPTDPPSASVTFDDQVADENGTLVTVESVALPDGGFVAIHRDSVSGPILGVSDYLPAGTHADVRVRLEMAVDDRTTLVAMAHGDDGDERFEWTYRDEDGPYTDDGEPVADAATVTRTRTEISTRTDILTRTDTPTPYCTGPGCGEDTPTPSLHTQTPEPDDWMRLLGPLLAFLAVATVGLLAVGAVLARWRLASDDD